MSSTNMMSYENKQKKAQNTIKEILSHASNPCICFSGGIKSLVLLHLIRSSTDQPFQVIFIDTTQHFENTCNYVEKMRRLWGFQLVKGTPYELPDKIGCEKNVCCHSLIVTPLEELIHINRYDYVFIGSISAEETLYHLLRMSAGKRNYSLASPIEDFTSDDLWQYINSNNLPYCSLYDNGYSKVDCQPCSPLSEPLEKNNLISDDEEHIKEKLKKLGYL